MVVDSFMKFILVELILSTRCMNPVTQHGLQSTSRSKPWLPIDHDGQYKIVYNKTDTGTWTQITYDMKNPSKPLHSLFPNGVGAFKE
jgi:hypothetical protein